MAVGTRPFVDFFVHQLPRIDSGAAFFWIEDPQMAPVNQSIYGLVTKLRVLGVPGTGQRAGHLPSSAYALLLLPLAIIAAKRLASFRRSGADEALVRLRHAQVWLGLLSLASFRSPFVPDAYGLVGTLWLMTLLFAERARVADRIVLIALAAAFTIVVDGGIVPTPVPAWILLVTLLLQCLAFAVNGYAVWSPGRRALTRPPSAPLRFSEPAYTAPPT